MSPPVANLLARAEDGIKESDWKFVIDSLQRVIEDPQRSLVRRSDVGEDAGIVYESARVQALRRLASLPREGLAAYRLLFDGQAKSLYLQAIETHDPSLLRRVVTHFFLTTYGDDAADTLASWELDADRPATVVALIQAVRHIFPDPDVPPARLIGKLVAAYTLLGRSEIARKIIEEYRTEYPEEPPALWMSRTVVEVSGQRRVNSQVSRLGDSWPMAGGTTERAGAMRLVEPSLAQSTPWHFDLPDTWTTVWERILAQDSDGFIVLPFSQLVADEQRAFVRTATGVVALDVQDMSKMWEVSEDQVVHIERNQPPSPIGATFDRAGSPPDLDNYASAAISVADGLVFILEGLPPQLAGVQADPALPLSAYWRSGAHRLLALHAETGKLAWSIGMDADPTSMWSTVTFRAAPLEVEGKLWIPFTRGTQYFVAVVDPQDGTLLKQILLCSVSQPPVAPRRTLALAYSSNTVVAPTEEGVVFAIDTTDYTLRWANQYMAKSPGFRSEGASRVRWIPSSPVVTDGRVLLTSIETGQLHCFDLVTGEMLWHAGVEDGGYLIAAAMGKVWVGGGMISCLSLADGSRLWATKLTAVLTGRAALSGGHVLVPVRDGLLTLDAWSGDRLTGDVLPEGDPPLGNLLCLRASLYSLDPAGVRRFPDFDRLYPKAKAAHELNQSAVPAALQLAQLELLKGDADRAYQILIDPALRSRGRLDAHLAGRVDHTLVDALLALSRQPGPELDSRLKLLEQAATFAKSSQDGFRCQMARVDELIRIGRAQEAFRRALEFGQSDAAQRLVSTGPNLSVQARHAVALHLRRKFERILSGSQTDIKHWVKQHAAELLKTWRDAGPSVTLAKPLRALVDLDPSRGVAPELLLELAGWNIGRRRYERAQQELEECLRLDAGSDWNLLADVVLARLMVEPFELVRSVLSRKLLALQRKYGAAPLPPKWRSVWNVAGVTDEATTVEEWIRLIRDSLGLQDPAQTPPSLVRADVRLIRADGPLWEKRTRQRELRPRLVQFVGGQPDAVADQVLYYDKDDVVIGLDLVDGNHERWQAPFRLPGTFLERTAYAGVTNKYGCRVVTDGQTGVIDTYQGLFAFGLRTGKRLWVYPHEALGVIHPAQRKTLTMAAGDGVLAASAAPGQLILVRLSDGQLLWRRSLRGETIAQVAIEDGVIIVIDTRHERAHLIRQDDGELIGLVHFSQPERKGDLVDIVWDAQRIVGPDCQGTDDRIVAYDLQTGKEVWKNEIDRPLVGIFMPAPRYVAAGLMHGYVRVLDMKTGELVVEHRVRGARRITGGVFVDGIFVTRQLDWRRQGQDTLATLYGLDLATGENLWQKEGLAPVEGRVGPLRVEGRMLPIVILEANAADRRRMGMLSVGFLDARSGELHGPTVRISRASNSTQFNGDLGIWDRLLVIGTKDGLSAYALSREPDDRDRSGGGVN